MGSERIELSAKERERLKVLQQVEEGHLKQIEAARRLHLTDRQVRRLQVRLRSQGDRGIVHRLRGRGSNRKIPESVEQHALRHLRQARYAGFGPTLAAEHLARRGMSVSRETLRKWMSAAGLWRPRNRRLKTVHVWRPRRSAFGELVMMDSSPYVWLEERGPACHLIALIDDASSRAWGRLVEHDSTEENLRTLQGWLERHGRPLALYTDKNSLFVTSRPVQWQEQLRGEPARTQFGRALGELGIEWIAAHSPQARGRSERNFGTWQGRLPQELRLRGIATVEEANRFLRQEYIAEFNRRFAVTAAQAGSAFLRLQGQDLERIFALQHERVVHRDNTVEIAHRVLQIEKTPWRNTLAGCAVTVYEHLDGTLSVAYGPHVVGRFDAQGIPLLEPAVRKWRQKAVEKTVAAPPWKTLRVSNFPTATATTRPLS